MAAARTYEGNGHSATIADPKNITSEECVALACCGRDAWNGWRREYPVWTSATNKTNNIAKFAKQDLRNQDIDFSGFEFDDFANFNGATFDLSCSFSRAKFGIGCSFDKTVFTSGANFNGAQFLYRASFENSQFKSGGNTFIGAQFTGGVIFDYARFEGVCSFEGAQFDSKTSFHGALFDENANLSANTWESFAWIYEDATRADNLKQNAIKAGISPRDFHEISFELAVFKREVNFAGRNFNAPSKFSGAQFGIAPLFHGCKLHQDTSFEGARFSLECDNVAANQPIQKGHDEKAARAYRTLKLAFAQQQAIREEQRFFKLEMEEEAARETGWRRWLYRAYRELSDFGFSVGRPMVLLVVTTTLAGLIYGWQAGLVFDPANTHTSALIHFSLASAVPGLEKLAEPAALRLFGEVSKGIANYSLPTVLTLLAHKAVSLLALFLIGLALRNLFKMK